jgi:DNA-binding IclR family transcriptional regulator
VDPGEWLARMRFFLASGYTYGLGENDDDIRGVAAPVRDVAGQIAAAVSVTSAAQYMNEARMLALSVPVRATAAAISAELGYVSA